jgi:molecular chaperone GrpE
MSEDRTATQDENKKEAATDVSAEELERLRKTAAERDQYLDMAQRMRAEFENYQKRSQKDREQERKYAFGPLAIDLLPVLDNLDRAVAAAQQAGDKGPLIQGVVMVQNQFIEMLKRNGITRIDAQGKPFDPNQHQAVVQQPSADVEPGTVLQVLEQGFMNQDRVLRPAKVIVSTKPS